MPGPGDYRPDPTEGITHIEDLPKPNVSCRSRNYRRRPCPRCGHRSYRDRRARRTLHDLGNPLTGRPRDGVRPRNDVAFTGSFTGHYAGSDRGTPPRPGG